MPRYLSAEKRDRLVQLTKQHHTLREIADMEHVSPETVRNAMK